MVQCFESYYQIETVLYDYIDRFLVPIMLLDILISFNTCYIDRGAISYDRREIARKYVKSFSFWVDLFCFIVSILQVIFNHRDNYSTGYNFFIFVKIVKVYNFDINIKKYALKSFNALLIY